MASVHPPARKSHSVGTRKDKGPKFVPYEPYKAAVTPMVAVAKAKVKVQGTWSTKGTSAPITDVEEEVKSQNRDTKPELAPQREYMFVIVTPPIANALNLHKIGSAILAKICDIRVCQEHDEYANALMITSKVFRILSRKRSSQCQRRRLGTRFRDCKSDEGAGRAG